MSLTLPEPNETEQAHSEHLRRRIAEAIETAGGWIDFSRYMEMALYEPGLGYYVAGQQKFGAAGDFVTAPEISPLFSRCLARQCAEVLRQQASVACILELGAGSGVMAAEILLELERLDCLPDHYYILELSAELAERQRQTLQARAPHLVGSVRWLQSLDGLQLHGVILANEVLDAMPVQCFSARGDQVLARGVALQNDGFVWREREADARLQEMVETLRRYSGVGNWPDPYHSEFNPNIPGWVAMLAEHLAAGLMLLIDYGYPRSDYYHPQRNQGTLLGHYRQRALEDPFWYPGLQDITASVDFTAVAEAGVEAGLALAGYTTQAWFLLANGLESLFQQALETASEVERLSLSKQIKLLTLPAEMGERFQVIGLSRGMEEAPQGFLLQDYSHKL